MEPRIQYAETKDGVNIAYWTMGEGPAVVWLQYPWSNIEYEAREFPWHGILASRCTLVRYDNRGTGLSHREVEEFSLDAYGYDLEAVVDRLALEQFILVPFAESGAIAIAYAADHPERVSHLLLYAAVARTADFYDLPRIRNAYAVLDSGDWEMCTDNLALAVGGWPDPGLARDLGRSYRTCTEPEQAKRMVEAYRQVDVTDLLPSLQIPVSIVYPKESPMTDIGLARTLAARVPNARLTIADSTTGWSPETQKAVLTVLDEALAEMGGTAPADAPAAEPDAKLPSGITAILFLDIAGSTALTTKLGDAAYRERERELDASLRTAITESGGTPVEGKVLGDGVMAVFTSARQAIDAAQRCRDLGNEAGLPLHLGIHAGDVLREGSDVHGGAVQVASRVQSAAAPGEILVSATVRDLARTSAGVAFEDRGDHELKGIPEPQRLFAVREQT